MLVNTINDMTDQLAIFAAEVKKVARELILLRLQLLQVRRCCKEVAP